MSATEIINRKYQAKMQNNASIHGIESSKRPKYSTISNEHCTVKQ